MLLRATEAHHIQDSLRENCQQGPSAFISWNAPYTAGCARDL